MPVTPYHFGPALVVKGVLKTRFCLIAFAISQIIIDLESAYHLMNQNYPVHRFLHSYLGATIAALVTILITRYFGKFFKLNLSRKAIIIASFFGGYSHVILDSIMHQDMRPFFPTSETNILLQIIDLPTLHGLCFYSGILGLVILTWQHLKKLRETN